MKNVLKKQREVMAVIGGGSVGVSFIMQLIEEVVHAKITDQVEIVLFEPQEIVGPGYAYQADYDCNLLNTAANTMSAKSTEKNHFLEWLKNNEESWRPHHPKLSVASNTYLPRSLFGLYLSSIYQSIVDKANEHGIPFQHVQDKVLDIVELNRAQSMIYTQSAGHFIANRIVLSLGNLPSDQYTELKGISSYFETPYPCRHLTQNIPPHASVCVIGTSLSAIDTVLSLKESGHTGSIVCVSRNGRFSSVRGHLNKPHQLTKLTKERVDAIALKNNGALPLKAVAELLVEEYQSITGEPCNLLKILNPESGMHDYIAAEIKLSSSEERVWQSIIYATNGVIDYVWHKLSVQDKRIFNRFFRSTWLAYRVSFPLANALKIREQLRIDKLHIFGGMQAIQYDEDKETFSIQLHDKRNGLKSIVQSDYVINATCFSTDVARSEVPLVKNLLKHEQALANEFGGFEIDYETGFLINAAGHVNHRISVLGSLAVGTYFWTNAMDVNARLAKKQATQWVDQLLHVIDVDPSHKSVNSKNPCESSHINFRRV